MLKDLLKVSLLILGAWIIYPLAQNKFNWLVGFAGMIFYVSLVWAGIKFLQKHYDEEKGGSNG